MKINRVLATCGLVTALCLSAGSVAAQDNNEGGQGRRGGGQGQGGGGRGNFDPAQMQQRIMENFRERLGFTNETEWAAVQPLVQKVVEARRDVGGFGGGMARRGGGGGGGNQDNARPEATALQNAIDSNAPAAQVKNALERYRNAQKDREAKLEQAQTNLRKVLTAKQEAQAVLMGLLK